MITKVSISSVVSLLLVSFCFGQTKQAVHAAIEADTVTLEDEVNRLKFVTSLSDSTHSEQLITYLYLNKFLCKGNAHSMETIINTNKQAPKIEPNIVKPKIKLLEIKGTIEYEYFYRSKLDSPFYQSAIEQHTERVNLQIKYKEKYPVNISFVARQGNSPFFNNFFDMNYRFDNYQFFKNKKQQLIDKIGTLPNSTPNLDANKQLVVQQQNEYETLKKWLASPSTLQKIIEEREAIFAKQFNNKVDSNATQAILPISKKVINNTSKAPTENISSILSTPKNKIEGFKKSLFNKANSLESKMNKAINKSELVDKSKSNIDSVIQNSFVFTKSDSLKNSFIEFYQKKKEYLLVLEKKLATNIQKLDSLKASAKKQENELKQKLYEATSEKELIKYAEKLGIKPPKADKTEKILSAIKSFGIGRNVVNYSDLTVQNVVLTGINVEYNPSYYIAFVAGNIDLRNRDFFIAKNRKNNQRFTMGRVGFGDKDKKAIIFSFYKGDKASNLYASNNDSTSILSRVVGVSAEIIYRVNKFTSFSAEFAKSTFPIKSSTPVTTSQRKELLNFKEPSNTAYNIKAETRITLTDSKISGFYRKSGENFQSFSLFSYNTNQNAWQAKLDQNIWKNKISFIGMLRQNDFVNPFATQSFKTSTTFKSAQLNIRIPKYPMLSIGYYPSSQFFYVNADKINENVYYILNASLTYSYSRRHTAMSSTIFYNKFFNQATDTGFINYNGFNVLATQSFFFKKFFLKAGLEYTDQPALNFYAVDALLDVRVRNNIKIGGGIKLNKVKEGDIYLGESISLSIDFKKWGGLQLQYDKAYIPNNTKQFIPIDNGRVSFYKTF